MMPGRDLLGRQFLIREARPDDAEAINAIMGGLAGEAEYILLCPDEVVRDSRRRAQEIARAATMGNQWHIAVVELGYEVVGMLDLRAMPMRKCRHVMELGLGLAAPARDLGVGTRMVEYALDFAHNNGYRKVRLFVIASNTRARHVYENVGFMETGRFVGEVRVNDRLEDLVVMERRLA